MNEIMLDDGLLAMAGKKVVEHLKEQGKTFTSEQEESLVQGLIGIARTKPPTETPIHDLVVTLEIVRDALFTEDKDKGFEAITVFLLQFMQTFNYEEWTFEMLPILETIKDELLSEQLEDALVRIIALLAYFRKLRAEVEGEQRMM